MRVRQAVKPEAKDDQQKPTFLFTNRRGGAESGSMRSLNLSMIIAVVFVFFSCGRGGIGDAAQDNRSPAPQKPTVIIGGDAKGRTVHPGEKAAIQNAGAEIWLDGDEISKATKFGINTLAPGDLAKLEGGMTNVTGGADSGYRFTPRRRRSTNNCMSFFLITRHFYPTA